MYIKNGDSRYTCTDFVGSGTDGAVLFYLETQPSLSEDEISLYAEGDSAKNDFLMKTVKRSDYASEKITEFGDQFILTLSNVPEIEPDINTVKNEKIQELSDAAHDDIVSGVSICVGDDAKSFSLETHDQQNISAICQYLFEHPEIESYLYHANGEAFESFTRDEMFAIRDAMLQKVTECTAAFNALRTQVYEAKTIDDVNNIHYERSVSE